MSLFDRAHEIASTVLGGAPSDGLAHPFGLGEADEPLAWRVSEDVWTRLWDSAKEWAAVSGSMEDRLLGYPLHIDFGLPPNSMLLEPRSAVLSAVEPTPDAPKP